MTPTVELGFHDVEKVWATFNFVAFATAQLKMCAALFERAGRMNKKEFSPRAFQNASQQL